MYAIQAPSKPLADRKTFLDLLKIFMKRSPSLHQAAIQRTRATTEKTKALANARLASLMTVVGTPCPKT